MMRGSLQRALFRITFLFTSSFVLPHTAKPQLLDDEAVRHFICEGFVHVKTELPAAFHAKLFKKVYKMHAADDIVGNNILPEISELHKVLSDRHVVGALQSVLGEDYYLHPHRHVHETFPGKAQQPLHQDSYFDYQQEHHHRPQWAMAMYYPQDVTVQLGPTRMIPGAHYFKDSSVLEVVKGKGHLRELIVSAGDVVIIHYNTWHWAGPNTLGTPIPGTEFANQVNVRRDMKHKLDPDLAKYRYMFKFQFMRMRQPGMRAPTWAHDSSRSPSPWQCSAAEAGLAFSPLWESTWAWMLGRPGKLATDSIPSPQNASDQKLQKLLKAFNVRPKNFEKKAKQLIAAYGLSQAGPAGVEALMVVMLPTLRETGSKVAADEWVAMSAAHGMCAAGFDAVAPLVAAARKILKQAKAKGLHHVSFVLGQVLSTGPLNKTSFQSVAPAGDGSLSLVSDSAEWNVSGACPADAPAGCSGAEGRDVLHEALDVLLQIASSNHSGALARRNAIEAVGMVGSRLVDDVAIVQETEQARVASALELIAQNLQALLEAPRLARANDFDFLPSLPGRRLASDQRRFMAAIALAQLRGWAAPASNALERVAMDPASTRYLKGYALEALRRVNTSESLWCILRVVSAETPAKGSKLPPSETSMEQLQQTVERLLKSRRCPLSTASSPY